MREEKSKKTSVDLTDGNMYILIIQFALPIMLGQLFQNLYNSVDSAVVGRYVGTTALAAVSSSSDISMLLTGFFTGLSTGAGILFSRYFGARDYARLHDAIHTAVTFAVLLGVSMTVAGILCADLLLTIVACPEDVFAEASIYLRIYLVGILFTAIYNVGSGVLRAMGDSRSPFYYLVISSITNICLDFLFIAVFHFGVQGAAFATICSQLLSVSLVFHKLLTADDVYKITIKDLRIDRELLGEVINLGIPSAIQSSLTAISNLFVQRYINAFGSSAMAGIGAAKKIDKFVGLTSMSIGQATATFVSQNNGAAKKDRAVQGVNACLILAFICVAIPGIVIYFFADFFIGIFTTDTAAIGFGVAMIRTMLPLYYCQSLNQIFSNATRGFGKSKAVMVLSLLGMIGCRQIFLAVSMRVNYSVTNIYVGYPVGWFFSALFVFIYYVYTLWKYKDADMVAVTKK